MTIDTLFRTGNAIHGHHDIKGREGPSHSKPRIAFRFEHNGQQHNAVYGRFDSGRVAEVFIDGFTDVSASLATLLLQRGVEIETVRRAVNDDSPIAGVLDRLMSIDGGPRSAAYRWLEKVGRRQTMNRRRTTASWKHWAEADEGEYADDIVVVSGMESRNADVVLLANHDTTKPIGRAKLSASGNEVKAHITFAPEGTTETADEYRKLCKAGVLTDLSIGFNPIERQAINGGGWRYTKWQCMEVSLVAVGCNPAAVIVQRSQKSGRVLSSTNATKLQQAHDAAESCRALVADVLDGAGGGDTDEAKARRRRDIPRPPRGRSQDRRPSTCPNQSRTAYGRPDRKHVCAGQMGHRHCRCGEIIDDLQRAQSEASMQIADWIIAAIIEMASCCWIVKCTSGNCSDMASKNVCGLVT